MREWRGESPERAWATRERREGGIGTASQRTKKDDEVSSKARRAREEDSQAR